MRLTGGSQRVAVLVGDPLTGAYSVAAAELDPGATAAARRRPSSQPK
jgi:hypothetical protein